MERVVSKIEQHFFNKCIALNKDKWLEEGIAEGEIKAVLKFIRIRRNRHFSESQILKDLQSDFELDEATASKYMATTAKA